MNLCEQTFARKFAADTGLTPRKLNENIIIDHAITLLENETLSIKEIAAELNFSNEYYFSRFFKRNTGVPPGRFRQKMQMQ
jgi:AraC-like DNA-binding protein